MLPRKPTRLEMKSDDMLEYEEAKEQREAQRAAARGDAMKTDQQDAASAQAAARQSKAERIGTVRK